MKKKKLEEFDHRAIARITGHLNGKLLEAHGKNSLDPKGLEPGLEDVEPNYVLGLVSHGQIQVTGHFSDPKDLASKLRAMADRIESGTK